MPNRQLRPREQATNVPVESQLSPEEIAAYIRQSTTRQTRENLESADLQLSGAEQYALSQGLDANKIMVAHEGNGKRGVSGTKRIDEREDLKSIMAGIEAGTIKHVWAYSVSRLFRDKYGVQVGTFIEACAEHGVKVYIENAKTLFDFSNDMHVFISKFLAQVAAQENEDRAKLLHGARNNKALRGLYDGRPLTPGFIVDRSKDSPTFGKYIEYAPHREVVEKLFARFRELGGQFNLLADEVGKMFIVFPPFAPGVDAQTLGKFQLKKVCKLHGKTCDCELEDCELAGYHVTRPTLLHILTAVEYVGYWKVDGHLLIDAQGLPVKNHEAIVDYDDWQYAFRSLSFVCLDGEDNKERTIGHTWVPAKRKKEVTGLLHGILTSPLGTLQCSDGYYKVSQVRDGKLHRSATLYVKSSLIDETFKHRFMQRLWEDMAKGGTLLKDQLETVKQSNATMLVSVDKQIKQYQKSIENRQNVMAMLGSSLDKATATKYNEDIIADRKNLEALQKKKNAAQAEERGLIKLCNQIDLFLAGKTEDIENLRRFIRLACERVEINEDSAHLITLTVVWRAPFSQTDVCYIYCRDARKQDWSEEEEQALRELYPESDRAVIMARFPTRTWAGIMAWAYELNIARNTMLNTSTIRKKTFSLRDIEVMTKLGIQPNESQPFTVAWDLNVNSENDSSL